MPISTLLLNHRKTQSYVFSKKFTNTHSNIAGSRDFLPCGNLIELVYCLCMPHTLAGNSEEVSEIRFDKIARLR